MLESSQFEVPERRTIHIKTFGCQMNVYDSDRMTAILEKQGYRYEPNLRAADVILLNTCAIRAKAEQKVLSLLGELAPLKQRDPKKIIGVSGCVGQRMGRRLLQRVPHLDLVMGPDGVDRVASLVAKVTLGERVLEAKLDEEGRSYTQPVVVTKARPAEFLTVMKGCDHFCTYCIVPYVRGREKSRAIAEIIEDVKRVVAHGAKEVTFLGQNINTYGKGTGESLAELIEQANKVEGLVRIRYVTSHPRDLGDDLIEQFGRVEKLCPALHLPAQSGSDNVLKQMSRLYTRAQYLEKVEKLRKACPEIAISGDFIVGFPGETDEDFEQTMSMVREVEFSNLFMFKYSPRPGTRAHPLGDPVPEKVKDERLAHIMEVAYAIAKKDNDACLGKTIDCLVEAIDKKGRYYYGRTIDNRVVHILNAGEACVGKFVSVEITDSLNSHLKGFYLGAPRVDRRNAKNVSASL